MESPPKRMTRARAAAKASEPAVKATKIVTAAAKARTAGTATASTKSTASKRKTRADDNDVDDDDGDGDGDGDQHVAATRRVVRGRPRTTAMAGGGIDNEAAAAAPAPARATRGRPTKKPAVEPSKTDEAPVAPARPRGRPRKTPGTDTQATRAPTSELARAAATTRSRAATATRAGPTKPAVKKTVKFEEPDKENAEPQQTRAKEPATAGMRGKPARRGGAAAARGARTTTKASSDAARKKPLSPKKVTQMPMSRDGDSSEDELAMDRARTPVKHLAKSPIKPPASVGTDAKRPEPPRESDELTTAHTTTLPATSLAVSPPRRPPASPFKDSLKSPAKKMGTVQLPGSTVKARDHGEEHPGQPSSFKASSLLQSAAKRPQSPIKGLTLPPVSAAMAQQPQFSVKKTMFQSPAKRAVPGLNLLTDSRAQDAELLAESPKMQPLVMATPTTSDRRRPSEKLLAEEMADKDAGDDDLFDNSDRSLEFPGRLSAVLSRQADPVMRGEEADVDDDDEAEGGLFATEGVETAAAAEQADEEPLLVVMQPASELEGPVEAYEPMALDDLSAEMNESRVLAEGRSEPENPMYQLRQKDQDPCHDMMAETDSEDEMPSPVRNVAATPARKYHGSRRSTIGFTSLAEQLGSWSAASPIKASKAGAAFADTAPGAVAAIQEALLDDEMLVCDDALQGSVEHGLDDVEDAPLQDLMITDEDVALAQEAEDLAGAGPQDGNEAAPGGSFDDGLSEASQEYGDENQVPVDPAIQGDLETAAATVPATPLRPIQSRGFFTTTKVPLKPADESTPSPLKQRSLSVSRLGSRRRGHVSRSASVISYSPIREGREAEDEGRGGGSTASGDTAPATPAAKADMWPASMGTPSRTPRHDLKPGLLRGAVVFVDVYTAEGADASGIFVELLGQMGARCVKSWHWTPGGGGGGGGDAPASKVGITHVVYKDGGKRTLEKVREAKGAVHCVGVSWVLDCERENERLDEGPYRIDTSYLPRGGARRRKSMEPKALNPSPKSSASKASQATPRTPRNRRDSSLWMHSPSDRGEQGEAGGGDEVLDWSCVLLTPVPKTPAPEAIAKYAAELPETPCGGGDDDDSDGGEGAGDDESPSKGGGLMTRTCPPKANRYRELGAGILGMDKDKHVLQRLMAARRKSLQFAPKVGSPLARTWD